MKEPQRLAVEQNLATARRALFRAHEVAERSAMYRIEDHLHILNMWAGELMLGVMARQDTVRLSPGLCTYLYDFLTGDQTSSPTVARLPRPPGLHAG